MKLCYRLLGMLCISSFFLYSPASLAQGFEAKNALYLEVGGNAFLYSLNYERIFLPNHYLKLGARAGISVLPDNKLTTSYPIIPLELVALTGKRKHHLELGIGLTPYVGYVTYDGAFGNEYRREKLQASSTFRAGYRYQKPDGGFMFRAGYMLMMNPDGYGMLTAGISIGKSF